ncbi:MAG: DUF456 family protein [Gammaproteobacteria bacterium]|nr:MAG: DUF456 family protein [Gammaproteobacteria bacterium]
MDPAPLVSAGLWALAILLVLAGIAGLALPALPGAPLLFSGLIVAAWAEDFAYIGIGTIITLALLALLTYPVELVAGAFGAKKFGASKQAMIGAGIGAVIGIFFGIAGILLGPFIGALVGELTQQRKLRAAGLSGIGATVGLLLGTVAKFAIAFAMIGLFLVMRIG